VPVISVNNLIRHWSCDPWPTMPS